MGVGVARNIWVGVDPRSGRAPVWSGRSEEVRGRYRHGRWVRRNKVDLLLVGVV